MTIHSHKPPPPRPLLALVISGLFALLAIPADADAQTPPGRPTPPGQRIVVERTTDLEFHEIVAGYERVVHPTSPDAAAFRVRAPAGSLVRLEFALPATVTDGDSGLPVWFDPGSAAWGLEDSPEGLTTFDPRTGATVQLPRGRRTIHVWLGGRIDVSREARGGTYQAETRLTAGRQ